MFEGDISTGREGEYGFMLPSVTSPGYVAVSEEIDLANGSLETVWNHAYSASSNSSLQFSFDQHRRADPLNPEMRNTYDLDYRHQFAFGSRQEMDGYLSKPIRPQELDEILEDYLRRREESAKPIELTGWRK